MEEDEELSEELSNEVSVESEEYAIVARATIESFYNNLFASVAQREQRYRSVPTHCARARHRIACYSTVHA
jgi:hypothetical protein